MRVLDPAEQLILGSVTASQPAGLFSSLPGGKEAKSRCTLLQLGPESPQPAARSLQPTRVWYCIKWLPWTGEGGRPGRWAGARRGASRPFPATTQDLLPNEVRDTEHTGELRDGRMTYAEAAISPRAGWWCWSWWWCPGQGRFHASTQRRDISNTLEGSRCRWNERRGASAVAPGLCLGECDELHRPFYNLMLGRNTRAQIRPLGDCIGRGCTNPYEVSSIQQLASSAPTLQGSLLECASEALVAQEMHRPDSMAPGTGFSLITFPTRAATLGTRA
jgi:hypothetical protein